MKIYLSLFFVLGLGSAQAAKVCYGRSGQCTANFTCASVEKVDDSLYRLRNLEQIKGCLSWGVSQLKIKNQVCQNILLKYGEKRKVKFVSHSDIQGAKPTSRGFESVGEISCEVKN